MKRHWIIFPALLAILLCSACGGNDDDDDDAATMAFPGAEWQTGAPADFGLDADLLEDAAAFAGENNSGCMAVVRDGTLIRDWYWDGNDPDSTFQSWSVAKSFTSAVIGIAITHGEIGSVEEPAADYIPLWEGTDREPIRLRHLLSMSSGLHWDFFSDYVNMIGSEDNTLYALTLPIDHPPNEWWEYNNSGVQTLEPVIRNATGMDAGEYAQQNLWGPIGQVATWARDNAGNPTTYANVLSSCRGMARFGHLLLNGGEWDGATVIDPDYVVAATNTSQALNDAYGYLIWLNREGHVVQATVGGMRPERDGRLMEDLPEDVFAAMGLGDQTIAIFPSQNMVVVRLGESAGADLPGGRSFTNDLLSHVLEAVVE